MRISALQFCPEFLNPQRNRDHIEKMLTQIETDLAVIPELAVTGYFFASAAQARECAEPVDGATAELLLGISRAKSMAICCGFAEIDGAGLFNSAMLALPDGRLSVYRKTHLFGQERTMFSEGDSGFQVVDYKGVRIGTMICYDWRFPEAARTLALRGAQIICHPSDLVAQPKLWQPVMRTRSVENKVCIITADRNGVESQGAESLEFHGCSQITAVNGAVLAEADETFEGWIHAEVDPTDADNKSFSEWNDIFSDRRPDMYAH
jgi:5-aminopentanamidase